ncbi:tripartite tricarboxylate transporter permease [Vibrio lentus]|nr:tripartite tricarboxylate transporter permease [Vibrio lentus]
MVAPPGVPGDTVAAVLLGALIVQSLTPGPLLLPKTLKWFGVFSSMLVANLVMLVIGLLGIRFFCRIIEVPKIIMIPIIVFLLSIVGAPRLTAQCLMWVLRSVSGLLGFYLN